MKAKKYYAQKVVQYDDTVASAVRFMPDFRQYVVDTDVFTPIFEAIRKRS